MFKVSNLCLAPRYTALQHSTCGLQKSSFDRPQGDRERERERFTPQRRQEGACEGVAVAVLVLK